MKNKKKFLLAAILILTIVSIGSYAIYKSTATGTSGFKTAKWYIELNNQDITTTNTFTFDLKAADWTHNAIIDSDETELVVIAPGSYGTFGIELDALETEVDVEYSITARVLQNDTEVSLSTINPNLSLGFYENDTLKSNPLTGSIAAHGTYNGEIRIVWDAVDSTSANSNDININDQNFVIEVTVVTKQKEKPIITASSQVLTNSTDSLYNIPNTEIYIFKGENPANYIDFNGQTWRIVGIYENQLKIINTVPLTSVRYNDQQTFSVVLWDESSLESYLNQETEGGYYYTLSSDAKELIAEGTWNIGAVSEHATATQAYEASLEKIINRKVGLLASYEFLYTANESSCYETEGWYYNYYNYCGDNWLKPNSTSLTLTALNSYNDDVLTITTIASIGTFSDLSYSNANPVVYLIPSAKITGGTGAPDNHYTLG